MRKSKRNKVQLVRHLLLPLLGAMALTCSGVALAQWKWIDASGVTQYTDRPPPASVPEDRILSRPSGSAASIQRQRTVPATPSPAPSENAGDNEATNAGPSESDRRLEDTRRRQEQEAERQRAEQERVNAQRRAQACDEARRSLQMIDSGLRIREVNGSGDAYYVDEQQRANMRRTAQQRVSEYCN